MNTETFGNYDLRAGWFSQVNKLLTLNENGGIEVECIPRK